MSFKTIVLIGMYWTLYVHIFKYNSVSTIQLYGTSAHPVIRCGICAHKSIICAKHIEHIRIATQNRCLQPLEGKGGWFLCSLAAKQTVNNKFLYSFTTAINFISPPSNPEFLVIIIPVYGQIKETVLYSLNSIKLKLTYS